MANRFDFPNLGIGLGLRTVHYAHLLEHWPPSTGSRSSARTTCRRRGGRCTSSTRSPSATPSSCTACRSRSAAPTRSTCAYLAELKALARPNRGALGVRSPLLDRRGGQEHARPPADAVHRGSAAAHARRACGRCKRSSGAPLAARESSTYVEFAGIDDDGMGFPRRARQGGRLRTSARREQHLRQRVQSRLRCAATTSRRSRSDRVVQMHVAGHTQSRHAHRRHAHRAGDRPGLGAARATPTRARAELRSCSSGTPRSRPSRKFTARLSWLLRSSRRRAGSGAREMRRKTGGLGSRSREDLRMCLPASVPARHRGKLHARASAELEGAAQRDARGHRRYGAASTAGVDRRGDHGLIEVADVERVVLPSSRLSSLERLDIYRQAYRARLVECLADDYPVLQHALGETSFETLVPWVHRAAPLALAEPQLFRSAHGRVLPRTECERAELSADLATLEWAMVEVLHAAPAARLSLEELASIAPAAWVTARFAPSATVRVFEFGYPVGAYLQCGSDGRRAPTCPAVAGRRPPCSVTAPPSGEWT